MEPGKNKETIGALLLIMGFIMLLISCTIGAFLLDPVLGFIACGWVMFVAGLLITD